MTYSLLHCNHLFVTLPKFSHKDFHYFNVKFRTSLSGAYLPWVTSSDLSLHKCSDPHWEVNYLHLYVENISTQSEDTTAFFKNVRWSVYTARYFVSACGLGIACVFLYFFRLGPRTPYHCCVLRCQTLIMRFGFLHVSVHDSFLWYTNVCQLLNWLSFQLQRYFPLKGSRLLMKNVHKFY